MNNLQIKQKGTVLVIAFLIMGVLMILGIYFLSFALTESRIAKSQTVGTQTYYLAEAGINEALWKLKYDETEEDGDVPWATCFVTSTASCGNCTSWSATFTRNTNLLVPNSTTTVTIQNSECARGRITATSTIALPGGRSAQRVVETTVFKSLASPTDGAAIFSGGSSENIDIDFSKIKAYGDLFSNHNLNIKWWSTVEVYDNATTVEAEGRILAVGNYNKSAGSTVSSTAICAKNICQTTSTCRCVEYPEKFQKCEENECPPKNISMPVVDFDSATSTSFKERASSTEAAGDCRVFCQQEEGSPYQCSTKCVFDDDEFEELLWEVGENGTLTLNTTTTPGIVYVTGPVELRGGRHLVVNGALVADGTIDIGERYKWTKGGQKDEGYSQITVNRPTATTTAGLLTKAKINMGLYSSFTTTSITGVIYANDETRLVSLPKSFKVIGGIIARKLSFISVWEWFNFFVDNEIILYGLGYRIDGKTVKPEYSPIITVEHWEETY